MYIVARISLPAALSPSSSTVGEHPVLPPHRRSDAPGLALFQTPLRTPGFAHPTPTAHKRGAPSQLGVQPDLCLRYLVACAPSQLLAGLIGHSRLVWDCLVSVLLWGLATHHPLVRHPLGEHLVEPPALPQDRAQHQGGPHAQQAEPHLRDEVEMGALVVRRPGGDAPVAPTRVHTRTCVLRHPSQPCPAHLDKRFHRVSGRQALLLNPKEVSTSVSQATAQQGHNVQIGAGHLHDPPGDKAGKAVTVTERGGLAAPGQGPVAGTEVATGDGPWPHTLNRSPFAIP